MIELSIVLPTCNRAALLERTLAGIESGVHCRHEVIVVDGASSDRTAEILAHAAGAMGNRLRVIRELQREGFVRAANKGFRAATGEYMTWLNDDARPMPGAFDTAIEQLESQPSTVAFVALFHHWTHEKNIACEAMHRGKPYHLCHVRGTLYANFPIGLRMTYQRLNYFDERFYVCGADPDLSLKAWHAGLSIVPAFDAFIDHDEFEDDRRAADSTRADADNQRLFEKWILPEKNVARNDFDPLQPCTLKGLRGSSAKAA